MDRALPRHGSAVTTTSIGEQLAAWGVFTLALLVALGVGAWREREHERRERERRRDVLADLERDR